MRLAALLAVTLLPCFASAQPERRPSAARRTVHTFDFEERTTNDTLIPRYWHIDQSRPDADRPGFPVWNRATLDYTLAAKGEGSLKLPTAGGSASLRLDRGVIPVFTGADYRVSALVHTRGLVHARACLIARMLDAQGQPIPGAESRSDLVTSEGVWTTIEAGLPGLNAAAAFLEIELCLLQADQFIPPTIGVHQVWPHDYDGAAWFDEVVVTQVARVELSCPERSHVFCAPRQPNLDILIRDLTGEAMTAHIEVFDARGDLVDRYRSKVTAGGIAASWTPSLPGLGWYRAILTVTAGASPVGRSVLDFAWLPQAPAPVRTPDAAPGFGFLVHDLPAPLTGALAPIARALNARDVTLPVFPDPAVTDPDAAAAQLSTLVSDLLGQHRRITLAIESVPPQVAASERIPSDDPLQMVARSTDGWLRHFAPLVERFGQRVNRWQVGLAGDDRLLWHQSSRDDLLAAESRLRALAPGPVIVAPWSSFGVPTLADPARREFAIRAPAGLSPDAVAELVAAWRSSSCGPAALVLEPLDRDTFGAHAVAGDLVRRAVLAWQALGPPASSPGPAITLALEQPWTTIRGRIPSIAPGPELCAWRTIADMLEGRRIIDELRLTPGVRCFILAPDGDPARGSALVAWREWASPRDAVIEAMLSRSEVRLIDPFGNVTSLHADFDRARRTTLHRLRVGEEPVFVEGIDLEIVLFQARVLLDPPTLPSASRPVDRKLTLANPWRSPIQGRFFLVSPGGVDDKGNRDPNWDIAPRAGSFTIPPGGSIEIPIAFAFSPLEPTGPRQLVVDVELSAEQEYGVVRLHTPVELVVEQFSLDIVARHAPRPGGPDLVIEASVANTCDEPLDLEVMVFAGDEFGRLTSALSNLEPDSAAARRFPLRNGRELLKGRDVFVSVFDRASGARLNRSIRIE